MRRETGPKRLLLVETDPSTRRVLSQVTAPIADLAAVADFQHARGSLLEGGFDILATNIRLETYNGLHLVYLIKTARLPTRAVVYSDSVDPFVAREAQQAGAFYEPMVRLIYSLPAYIDADLPALDRRDPTAPDRRMSYRGGRRRSDVPLSAAVRARAL